MASASGAFSSYPSLLSLRVECYIIQSDPGNNRSLVRADVYIDFSGGSATSYNNTVNLNVNGNTGSWNIGTQSYSGAGARLVVAGFDTWVGHDANGYLGGIGFSVSASTGGWGSAGASGGLGGFNDYDRKPSAPGSCTAFLNSDKSVTVNAGSVSSPAGTPTFYVQYASSTDGGATYGAWTAQNTMSSQAFTYTGLTFGRHYKFRVWASNSDGSSAFTESAALFIPVGVKAKVNNVFVNSTSLKAKENGVMVDKRTLKVKTAAGWVNPV